MDILKGVPEALGFMLAVCVIISFSVALGLGVFIGQKIEQGRAITVACETECGERAAVFVDGACGCVEVMDAS
jgi:hypothetical protein